jgi:NAD(P)-dependent dehydrogenase (short-subunit alcohol dehydrogenase family)
MSLLFPLWQVEPAEYEAICRHLGIRPKAALYDKVAAHLASAPFRAQPPTGFARYLALPSKTHLRIALLDPATKLLYPSHPLRHALNAVISVHECDGESYRQMARIAQGRVAVLALLGWSFSFALRSLASMVWLAGHFMCYFLGHPFRRSNADLRGQRVLITGVSRGLGFDLMLECLERGAGVIGVVRTAESVQAISSILPGDAPVRFVIADLAVPGALADAMRADQAEAADLSMVFWCAGVKHDGAPVLALPELRNTFAVNFFSAAEFANWLYGVGSGSEPVTRRSKADRTRQYQNLPSRDDDIAKPSVPRQHRQTFVLISSIGRWHGMHQTGGYNASKAALSVWGESLEMELRLAGRRDRLVTIVEPGMFASDMTKATGLSRFLVISRREIARRIVAAGCAGKKSIRPPLWFALVTWVLCALGRDARHLLFSRAKPMKIERQDASEPS